MRATSDEFDWPEECPICGADMTIDRRTDVDDMYHLRRNEHNLNHYRENHRVLFAVARAFALLSHYTERIVKKVVPWR